MSKLKDMLFIGNFQNKNIYYHFNSGKLYSNDEEPGKQWDSSRAILVSGLLLTNVLGAIGSFVFSNIFIKYGLLLTTVLAIILVIEWALKPRYQPELILFDSKRYFGWSNFLEQSKSTLFFIWPTGIVTAFLMTFFLLAYLQKATFYNYLLFASLFFVAYVSVFKTRPIKRFIVLRKLLKEASNG
ncbi:hypothetical protein ACVRXQ_13060 [Streptococcus panodentis]|uniref:DUF443 family protein n=1 Tax=Streptococcus panodentis TaxID=1581472 RepID=A0ABS5B0M3_9STRE|nr:hypothetical protein [Streptococcus panodentis]MBP2622221.1 hypothetical protein [Streptococcus panodentis]